VSVRARQTSSRKVLGLALDSGLGARLAALAVECSCDDFAVWQVALFVDLAVVAPHVIEGGLQSRLPPQKFVPLGYLLSRDLERAHCGACSA